VAAEPPASATTERLEALDTFDASAEVPW
jgi:hypothetical protein